MKFALLLTVGLAFCLTACGTKSIPYSSATDAPEPSLVAKSHYNWGITASEQGDFGQAIIELNLAIQNEPGWVMPYFILGVVYGNQGNLDLAIPAWERAAQLDADFAKVHYNLAVAYSLKAEKMKSIASLREAIRLNKDALRSAETESAFDNIRNTPEYQKVIRAHPE